MEVLVQSLRVVVQNQLDGYDYAQAMFIELEELDEARLDVLDHLQAQKNRVAKAYNKKVKPETFGKNYLVWKAILPLDHKDPKYGKWSPNWEGHL